VLVGARLMIAVVQVVIANRRRRAHHRMVVDLVGVGNDVALAQPCARTRDLRILDVPQPLAYCLPGVRSRVVVSEGTLTTLADDEVTAILTHERAHLRARHDLVLEAFTAVHAAFPRLVRSASALGAVQLLVELLADDAAVRAAGRAPLARALVACASGSTPSGALAAGGTSTVLRVRRLAGGRIPRRGGRICGTDCRAGRTVAHRAGTLVQPLAQRRAKHIGGPLVRCATVWSELPYKSFR
jgi:Zn-dependent protease with chaperone function